MQDFLVPERSDVGEAEGAWEGFCSGKLVFDEFLRENAECYSYRTPFLGVSLGRQAARASTPAGWQGRFLKSFSCPLHVLLPSGFLSSSFRIAAVSLPRKPSVSSRLAALSSTSQLCLGGVQVPGRLAEYGSEMVCSLGVYLSVPVIHRP